MKKLSNQQIKVNVRKIVKIVQSTIKGIARGQALERPRDELSARHRAPGGGTTTTVEVDRG